MGQCIIGLNNGIILHKFVSASQPSTSNQQFQEHKGKVAESLPLPWHNFPNMYFRLGPIMVE